MTPAGAIGRTVGGMEPKWRAFAAMAMTYFLLVSASSMSFLVLPDIAEDFDVTLRTVGWVVIIESLLVAACLLPVGSLADRVGRRRILWWGMAIFCLGLVATGLAPTFPLLIAGRVVSAIGNVLAQSVATGILVAAFPPHERGLAMGGQTTAVGAASASGPLIGGLLLGPLSWEWLFLLLAIPVAATLVIIPVVLDDDSMAVSAERRRADRLGGVLAGLAIVLVVVTANNPFEFSWLSVPVIGGGVAAAIVIAAFVRHELGHDAPMLDLRLFALPAFGAAVAVRVMGFAASAATTLLIPIQLISVRGLSSRTTGVVLASYAVGMAISAQISGRLYDRLGPRPSVITGLSAQAAIMTTFAFTGLDTSLGLIIPITIGAGLSLAMWNVPANSSMMGATSSASLGVVGAFTNVTRTFGSVLGQAAVAAIVAGILAGQGFDIPLADIADTAGADDSFVDGWRAAFLTAAAVSVAALVPASRLPGRSR